MMKKILLIILSVCLSFSLLLSGCGYAPEDNTMPTGNNVLTLVGQEPYTLDPAKVSDSGSVTYIYQIFSGLLKMGDDLTPVADIAQSWEVSPDGLTYTFYLKPNVKFHNGRVLTAADFKYSWERAASPATASNTVLTFLGDIQGVTEMVQGQANSISGVTVVDDLTLKVKLVSPCSFFLSKISYVTAFVVDKDNVSQGSDWWKKPVGTGPFMLPELTQGNYIMLNSNPDYYDTPAKISSVIFRLQSGQPMDLYEVGGIDVAGVSADYLAKATDPDGVFSADLQVVPQLSFYYFAYVTSKAPFDDPKIRQAFSMAVDKARIIELSYKGSVSVAEGILPPGMPGYNPDLSGLEYNPERARELIAESSYGSVENLPTITLTASGWGGLLPVELEAVIDQWRQNLGVEVVVRQIDMERFLYDLQTEKDNLYYSGWVADYPHPQDFLSVLFETTSSYNSGDYSNPEVDALLVQAAATLDTEESMQLYAQAEQILINDAACLSFWFGKNYMLVKPYVKGYKLNAMGIPILTEVTLEAH
ncbi:MAG: ABC transporter substrate-binding protein [Dehalococcoides mccartyi]|uniref:peptide ABC transporter substrate-binding protein n=1 Tax=Dehalococcoides mccartyi TaxID=61435 RepID=UPI000804B57C|nr:peptide ABC transporter substrate-binding protein [Dehalococcoides mccartyi]OBW63176.1 MAG: ABC transporter substrate-binding protein [Dehalococcoides mccartyi]